MFAACWLALEKTSDLIYFSTYIMKVNSSDVMQSKIIRSLSVFPRKCFYREVFVHHNDWRLVQVEEKRTVCGFY